MKVFYIVPFKDYKENIFLILGEPGSGKSTTLRKLANDMLNEVDKTNKIPLYINLREWSISKKWSETNPPTVQHLNDFIFKNLIENIGDPFVINFLEEYYEILYKNGHFLFIFDSFDEIPGLLDESEMSWLVDSVASVLHKFVSSNKNMRSILSSRHFRKPTDKFVAQLICYIRPFDAKKIQICFEKYFDGQECLRLIYKEQKGLIRLAGNPFYSSMIALFFKKESKLPNNEIDLFETFISTRLEQAEKYHQYLFEGVSKKEILEYTQMIAKTIFNESKNGIEIAQNYLLNNIPKNIIDILQRARIIRIGSGEKNNISFSHRRFNEYFVAKSIENLDITTMDCIPKNSKWRDTLVLYAQICNPKDTVALLNFCCSFLDRVSKGEKIHQNANFRKAISAYVFLVDAFLYTPQRMGNYINSLINFTNRLLNYENVFYDKIVVKAIPILPQEEIIKILKQVLQKDVAWVNDDAVAGGAYLEQSDKELCSIISIYYNRLSIVEFYKRFKNILFMLSLTKEFKRISIQCKIKFIDPLLSCSLIVFFMIYGLKNKSILYYFIIILFFLLYL